MAMPSITTIGEASILIEDSPTSKLKFLAPEPPGFTLPGFPIFMLNKSERSD